MDKEEIIETFKNLSKSQIFYKHKLKQLEEMTVSEKNNYLSFLESQNFKNKTELVLFVEN